VGLADHGAQQAELVELVLSRAPGFGQGTCPVEDAVVDRSPIRQADEPRIFAYVESSRNLSDRSRRRVLLDDTLEGGIAEIVGLERADEARDTMTSARIADFFGEVGRRIEKDEGSAKRRCADAPVVAVSRDAAKVALYFDIAVRRCRRRDPAA